MTQLSPPYPAPKFDLEDHTGKRHQLSDYKGRWLVVYFYPKDDTPGCTVEACSLRDTATELSELDAEIIGISADDAKSHEKFIKKHHLNFTLLADPEKRRSKHMALRAKKMFGKEGILRKTFIINAEGQVVKVYGRVTPLGHGEQVIDELKRLQKA